MEDDSLDNILGLGEDPYASQLAIDGSLVPTTATASSGPSYSSSDYFSLAAPASTSTATTLGEVNQGVGILSGLSNIASSLFKTVSTPNVAGTYNAQGQFIPLSSSSGLLSVPGQTSILGNGTASPYATSPLGNIGNTISSTLSGTLGSLTPFIPYLLIGGVILLVLKIGKKL